jgi:hypothetical protein
VEAGIRVDLVGIRSTVRIGVGIFDGDESRRRIR